jgi:hypothetical protein
MSFFVCFVFWTKQQQQLQFVQYDGLPQHPNPNFQMLEDVIITSVFQSMQEEEEEILTLMSIKKISILVMKASKSREKNISFKEKSPFIKRTKRTKKKKNTEGKQLELKQQGITNTLALPIDKMLYIYLLHPHSEPQKSPFQSKQSKHFHQRNRFT